MMACSVPLLQEGALLVVTAMWPGTRYCQYIVVIHLLLEIKVMFSFTIDVHFLWTAGWSRWKQLLKMCVCGQSHICVPYPCYSVLYCTWTTSI